jgi:hypothetical protein
MEPPLKGKRAGALSPTIYNAPQIAYVCQSSMTQQIEKHINGITFVLVPHRNILTHEIAPSERAQRSLVKTTHYMFIYGTNNTQVSAVSRDLLKAPAPLVTLPFF